MSSSYTTERHIPPTFDMRTDDNHLQRELSDFTVTRHGEKISICALDEADPARGPIIAKGQLSANGKSMKTVSEPLVEWCIEYSNDPRLWVRSENVWYKLTKPSKDYARTHDLARRRFELSARIFILLTNLAPNESTFKGVAHLLSCPYLDMKPYSEKEILAEKDFILSQFRTLTDPLVVNSPFMRDLKKKISVTKKSVSVKSKKASSPSSSPPPSTPNGIAPAEKTPAGKPWTPSAKLDEEGFAKLMKRADKAITALFKMRTSMPFQVPVQPNADGCPDYWDRIRNPMDYGTIKNRIASKSYKSLAEVVEDSRLVTRNCFEYNGPEHDFSNWALSLERKFEAALRTAEEAEIAAMMKRTSSKKRRASELPPSAKTTVKKAAKTSAGRKGSKSSLDRSPSTASPFKEEESVPLKMCARAQTQHCDKVQAPNSKYCSEACGLHVARQRLAELNKAGFNADEYVRAYITKALVHSRS